MKKFCLPACILLASIPSAFSQKFAGRWDLTIVTPEATYPSWMEITEKNGKPEARVVARTGSVHPATEVKIDGSHLRVAAPEQFGKRTLVVWDLTEQGGKLT